MNNGLPKVIASQTARRIDAVSSAARYGSSGSTSEKESGAPGYQHSAGMDWNRGGARTACFATGDRMWTSPGHCEIRGRQCRAYSWG